jgi:hypothetical protein
LERKMSEWKMEERQAQIAINGFASTDGVIEP